MLRKVSALFRTFITSIGIALLLMGYLQGQVQAAQVLTVNTLAATNDGICDAFDCSLLDAVTSAESGSTIKFASGLSGTITLAGNAFDIATDLTIEGPGADVITLSGGHINRIFTVANDANAEI